jgi:hypothetical protein
VLRRRPRHGHADPKGLKLQRFIASAAACGSLILGAAGCGGGGSSEDVDPALLAPSKAGYISQADGLCGFYQDRTKSQAQDAFGLGSGDFKVLKSGDVVFRPGKRPADEAITSFVSSTVVPDLHNELGELRAIRPPNGDEAMLTAVYDDAQRAADALGSDPSAALDPARMKALFGPPLQSARAYGFRICGARPPTVPAG